MDNKIIEYLKETPYNTNMAVLKSMLGEGDWDYLKDYFVKNPNGANLSVLNTLIENGIISVPESAILYERNLRYDDEAHGYAIPKILDNEEVDNLYRYINSKTDVISSAPFPLIRIDIDGTEYSLYNHSSKDLGHGYQWYYHSYNSEDKVVYITVDSGSFIIEAVGYDTNEPHTFTVFFDNPNNWELQDEI